MNKMAAMLPKTSECVRVVVRVRPLNSKEKQDGRERIVDVDSSSGQLSLRNPKADGREPPKNFTFDSVFGPDTQQRNIYDTTAAPIVESVIEGYNGTIFAYGQTGAGKSHTMEGYPDPPELRGLIPNSFRHIFQRIATSGGGESKAEAGSDTQFLVRASYLEIYNEEIRDLLSKDPKNRLELKESVDSGVYVRDLKSFVVKSVQEIDQVMQAGKKNRSVGSTLMNQTSSRSHSIFTVTIETSSPSEDGEAHIRVGKLNMVDLAGSERQSKTGATGTRLKEATKINLSLSALGNVISALVDGKSQHIPYRDSKLTRLLQNSLGGNTKTVMCANCGPADYNYDETLSTLRYANRAKNIKNKPKINEDPKDAMLREFQQEIMRLKEQLAAAGNGDPSAALGAPGGGGGDGGEGEVVVEEQEVVERVIEKVVIKKEVGVSEEQLREMERKAAQEAEEVRAKSMAEIQAIRQQQQRSEMDRKRLQDAMEKQKNEAAAAAAAKDLLNKKLLAMQEKLLKGGQLMDQAARQESELRRAQLELEAQRRQESQLSRELAEREEETLMVEEKFSSLQEEAETKTKKLQKLWTRFKAAKTEIDDLQEEFQRDREHMLNTIRDLTRQLKLKHLIINSYVPPDELQAITHRAEYSEESDDWTLPRLQLAGNSMRSRRPPSASTLRRPETEYSRRRGGGGGDGEGLGLGVDGGFGLGQGLTGAGAGGGGGGGINANPYFNYSPDERERQQAESNNAESTSGSSSRSARPKSGMRRSKSRAGKSRPGTASRRGRGHKSSSSSSASGASEGLDVNALLSQQGEEQYPSARGLVTR